MSKRGKQHQRKAGRIDFEADNVSPDAVESGTQNIEETKIIGYIGCFAGKGQVKRKIKSHNFFFCAEHKPEVGKDGCVSLIELMENDHLITYKESICRVADCPKPIIGPLKKSMAFWVSQKQGIGINSDLKGDLLKAMDSEPEHLEKSDQGLNIHTKTFAWKQQFELVQFLVDWKAELTAGWNTIPQITATAFRKSECRLRSFVPVFLVRIADNVPQESDFKNISCDSNAEFGSDFIADDLKDIGCDWQAEFNSYVCEFASLGELVAFMRQFGGTLRVEEAADRQKQQVLPTITLSGGNRVEQFLRKTSPVTKSN